MDTNNMESNNTNNDYLLDALTSFYNQNFFIKNMNEIARKMIQGVSENKINQNNNNTWSILFCDIDALKYINDSFGHVKADIAIKNIAKIIKECIRTNRTPSDTLIYPDVEKFDNIPVRVGGDEFIIILPNCTKEQALIIKDRINQRLSQKCKDIINMTLSIGIADTSEVNLPNNLDINDVETVNLFASNLISLADANMRAEKKINFDELSEEEQDKAIGKGLARIYGFDVRNPNHLRALNRVSGGMVNDIVARTKNVLEEETNQKNK